MGICPEIYHRLVRNYSEYSPEQMKVDGPFIQT